MYTLRRWATWTFASLILTAVVWTVCWWFWGETRITATLPSGEVIDGVTVEIDGEDVGETPYMGRLLPGLHIIRIYPPDEDDATYIPVRHEVYLASVVLGSHVAVEFRDTSATDEESHRDDEEETQDWYDEDDEDHEEEKDDDDEEDEESDES